MQNNTTNLREERDFFLRQKFLQNFLYMLWYAFPVLVTLPYLEEAGGEGGGRGDRDGEHM